MNKRNSLEITILALSIIFSSGLFIWGFRLLPLENTTLGLDWKTIWDGIYRGKVVFGNSSETIGGMYTPPWGIILLLPLGFLSFRDSWGIISLISLVGLISSVPKKNNKLDIFAISLLVLCFPSLRNFADGNLEGLVIGGVAVMLWAFRIQKPILLAMGMLIASIKFQETWLLSLMILYLINKNWSSSDFAKVLICGGIVSGISMLFFGQGWIESLFGEVSGTAVLSSAMGRGSLIDISLSGAMERLGVSSVYRNLAVGLLLIAIFLLLYILDKRDKLFQEDVVGLLLVVSMLVAPYVSGNSFLTVVAIGVVPLFQANRLIGSILFVLINLPFIFGQDILYYYQSYYWTFLLVTVLLIFSWRSIARKNKL